MSNQTLAVRHFAKDDLKPAEVLPGASMWAVSLDHTQLTYFEVDPHTRFDTHQHASEQITYVLKGVLYVEVDGARFAVRKGEAIAIPSNVPHAVFTEDERARAVDAWSPVMAQYQAATPKAKSSCC